MSWIHSSDRALGVLIALALLTAAAGTAAALTIDGAAPEPAGVGEEVTMQVTIRDPFANAPDRYTLRGSTELEGASFTVVATAQGTEVNRTTTDGPTFEQQLDFDSGATVVNVTITGGTVPPLNTFDYRNQSAENYTALRLVRVTDGATTEIATYRTHRYTERSNEARRAIDNASAAIEAAGGGSSEARTKLNQSISAYDAENFGNAVSLAREAENLASDSSGPPILLIGGAAVVLVLVVGGVLYVRSGSEDEYKLQ